MKLRTNVTFNIDIELIKKFKIKIINDGIKNQSKIIELLMEKWINDNK